MSNFRKHSQEDFNDLCKELEIHVRIFGSDTPSGEFAQRTLDAITYLLTPDAWFDEMSDEVGAQADLLDSAWMYTADSDRMENSIIELIPLKFLDSHVYKLHPTNEGIFSNQYTVEDITNVPHSKN